MSNDAAYTPEEVAALVNAGMRGQRPKPAGEAMSAEASADDAVADKLDRQSGGEAMSADEVAARINDEFGARR